jgi:hypothetical protein
MTSAGSGSMGVIEGLLADRQKYESWLGTLESRRAITPLHVYERVRADYEARLQEVMEQLGARSSEVQGAIDSLTSRLTTLQSDEGKKRDERYEAELRHAVGEYAPEQWKKVSHESDAEITRLSAERGEVSAELQKMQQILGMVTARRSVPEPEPAPPPPLVPPPPSSPAPRVSAPRPRMATPAPEPVRPAPPVPPGPPAAPSRGTGLGTPIGGGAFDELEFLKSVIEPKSDGGVGLRASGPRPAINPQPAAASHPVPAAPAQHPPPPPAAPPPPPAAPVRATPLGLREPTPAHGSSSAAPAAPSAPAGAGGGKEDRGSAPPPRGTSPGIRRMPPAAGTGAGTAGAPSGNVGGAAAGAPDDGPSRRSRDSEKVPSFLKDVPSEQVKTLKCQECGTMNYPTEWYCERCGGELAAM